MCELPVRMVTDSTCNLPAETLAWSGICVVPWFINAGEQGVLDG
jgi:fatty acid-binding protein DegV